MGSNGTLGAVRVANEVIASIAALAACEMEGVAGMDETAVVRICTLIGRIRL